MQYVPLLFLQIDGCILPEWQDLEFHPLAFQFRCAYKHRFAVPEVILHEFSVGIYPCAVPLVVYLNERIVVGCWNVDNINLSRLKVLVVRHCRHLLRSHLDGSRFAATLSKRELYVPGVVLCPILLGNHPVVLEQYSAIVCGERHLVVNLKRPLCLVVAQYAYSDVLDSLYAFYTLISLSVNPYHGLLPLDGDEIESVADMAEWLCVSSYAVSLPWHIYRPDIADTVLVEYSHIVIIELKATTASIMFRQ